MGYFASLLISFVFPVIALGSDQALSQERLPQEHWQPSLASDGIINIKATSPNVMPTWPLTIEELNAFATEAAQIRMHNNPNSGNFMRRGPWLYPNNGCYAKAAHVSALALQKGFQQPGKIYAYGNLEFNSPYAKNGRRVYWRYHMAAAYVFNGEVMVIDPGISSSPMTQEQWFSHISPLPNSVRPKYCDVRNYSPLATCVGGRGNGANLNHVRGILRDEWSNLIRLGYNPAELLGP